MAAVTKGAGRVQTTVYMAPEAWGRIRRMALDRGCTAADLVNEAVAAWLTREDGGAESAAPAAQDGESDQAADAAPARGRRRERKADAGA